MYGGGVPCFLLIETPTRWRDIWAAIKRLAKSQGAEPYIEALSAGMPGTDEELQRWELERYRTTTVAQRWKLAGKDFEREDNPPPP